MRIRLGRAMSLGEIARATRSAASTNRDRIIKYISTDTRELVPGDLFIGIKGERYNGEAFTMVAKSLGAYVMSSEREADVICDDGGTALLSFAEYYAKTLPNILYRIGITGSVGKTTVKEFLYLLLKDSFLTHRSEGNHNNHIGMPMSILSAKENCQILLMEMGMNRMGEIGRLSECLHPNVAVITNIGSAHIGNLGSREKIAEAKLQIKDSMDGGIIILPSEEPLLRHITPKVTFSLADKKADYRVNGGDEKITVFRHGEHYCTADFTPNGDQNRSCLAAAVATAVELGVNYTELKSRISKISNDNTRQKLLMLNGFRFYTDFYNASYESVLSFINSAKEIANTSKKHLLLGDILELGDMAHQIHRMVGESISPDVFSRLFLFGDFADHVAEGAVSCGYPQERIHINKQLSLPHETAKQIYNLCDRGDLIFMKASRGVRLERVLECFREVNDG